MYLFLILLFVVQQWTTPVRVSPDSLDDTHPAICIDDVGFVWIYWYNSNHLWTRCYRPFGGWSEVFLIDTAKCKIPQVTTSSACKGTYEIPDWIIAWVDSSSYIRLSLCDMMPPGPAWYTTPPDSRIMGYNPAITSDTAGNIWCVWADGGCYMASCYDGTQWSDLDTLQKFPTTDTLETFTAGITTNHEGNIWVAYNGGVIWAQYWDGANWSTPETLSVGYAGSAYTYPMLCSDSQKVWIAWLNSVFGNWKILCRYHNGMEWSEIIEFPLVSDTLGGYHNPHQAICLDNQGRLWAGWWEETWIEMLHYIIIGGSYSSGTWDDTAVVDYYYGACGGYPSIAYGDNKVWMVWQSEKEGNYNIYGSYTEVTGVEDTIPISMDFALLQNYPNPFNTLTSIRYVLPNDSYVELTVYGIQGHLVRRLTDGWKPSGIHSVGWDGKDEWGRDVGSGIYFYQLKAAGGIKITRKMVILR